MTMRKNKYLQKLFHQWLSIVVTVSSLLVTADNYVYIPRSTSGSGSGSTSSSSSGATRNNSPINNANSKPNSNSNNYDQNHSPSHQDKIIEWMRSTCNGYFNENQEFRHSILNDSSSPFGIFATNDINDGDLLTGVPWECTIHGWDPELDVVEDGDEQKYLFCGSIRSLINEIRKGDDSLFSPYNDYLMDQPRGKFPSDWSDDGKDLLDMVLGYDMLPPMDVSSLLDTDWYKRCQGDEDDLLEVKAAMEHWSRADDNILVPLYDLYNHANGYKNNAIVQMSEHAQETFASRNIRKGEQIFISYNLSPHVDYFSHNYYGTPEFLRDYGFVESMPQRWIFHQQNTRFELDYIHAATGDNDNSNNSNNNNNNNNNNNIQLNWIDKDDSHISQETLAFFKSQLIRLVDVVEPRLYTTTSTTLLPNAPPPQNELDTIRQYFQALKNAISIFIQTVTNEQKERQSNKFNDINDEQINEMCNDSTTNINTCTSNNNNNNNNNIDSNPWTYPPLQLNYKNGNIREPENHVNFPTYNEESFNPEWIIIDIDRSGYQNITWVHVPTTNDVCFLLDHMVQTCSCFRPHYHDIAAHFPTRYIDEVRRVAIIGGGDSIMLNEMLKYPSIEFVLHLELDMKVVRKSLKYFASPPHFHDPRVQWWFGDAAKSLLLLPPHYFGTFDLVFVDLSESGPLSLSVSDNLTVWDSLVQLLNPDGILIKNELYQETLDNMFDTTMLVYFEHVPLIRSWALSLGTNRHDLLNPNPVTMNKWRDIDTVYERFDAGTRTLDDHFIMVHDYHRNDVNDGIQGNKRSKKCNNDTSPETHSSTESHDNEPTPATGIFLILEAENTSNLGRLLESPVLESTLLTVLKQNKFNPLSTLSYSSDDDEKVLTIIIMVEGVITTRTWPSENYCAFDVQLWGAFDKIDDLQKGLTDTVGSSAESLSSYRMVTGGIPGGAMVYGTNNKDDMTTRGGVKTSTPNTQCNISFSSSSETTKNIEGVTTIDSEETILNIAIKESLEMFQDGGVTNSTVVVLCGIIDSPCRSFDAVSPRQKELSEVIAIQTCLSLLNLKGASDGMNISRDMFDCEMTILDQLHALVSQHGKITTLVIDDGTSEVIVKIMDRIWRNPRNRKNFLHNQFSFIALVRDGSEIWMRDFFELRRLEMVDYNHLFRAEVLLEATSGEHSPELHLLSGEDPNFFSRLINTTTAIERMGIATIIRRIEGGIEEVNQDQQTTWYSEDDFDRQAGESHFVDQQPLGEQSYIQFIITSDVLSVELLETAVLEPQNEYKVGFNSKTGTGGGLVVTSTSIQGTVVLIWDGNVQVDINVFAYESEVVENFVKGFTNCLQKSGAIDHIEIMSNDQMPRGIGRVVNLWKDL